MKKKYLVPAIYSFFIVGLGQIIKGESEKGTKYLIWFYLGIPLIIYLSLLINIYLFLAVLMGTLLFYPIFWAYNIHDAYRK